MGATHLDGGPGDNGVCSLAFFDLLALISPWLSMNESLVYTGFSWVGTDLTLVTPLEDNGDSFPRWRLW
ncbi:MAG: hypothetical protein GY832_24960 [Chloroflexi bacterium]|nr:hypothetical protein [Chloroflexota bacterium]